MRDFMSGAIRLSGGVLVMPDGGVAFPQLADWFEVKAQSLGPDHLEGSMKRPRYYVEGTEDDLTQEQASQLARIRRDGLPEPTEADLADRRALCLRISANRAKSRVRKLCKVMGANTILTLTYRANQTDLALCKKHLKAFVRRCRRFWPGFTAVAIYEPQKRGAWHVHMAMANIPFEFLVPNALGVPCKVRSFNLIREQWRRVAGEFGGNIDVSARKRNSKRTAAQIAAYLAKYLGKAFEDGEAYSNRYTRFGGEQPPSAVHIGRYQSTVDALADLYALIDGDASIATQFFSPFSDWFYVAAERLPKRRGAA